jgi:hypothetical protein
VRAGGSVFLATGDALVVVVGAAVVGTGAGAPVPGAATAVNDRVRVSLDRFGSDCPNTPFRTSSVISAASTGFSTTPAPRNSPRAVAAAAAALRAVARDSAVGGPPALRCPPVRGSCPLTAQGLPALFQKNLEVP